MNERRFRIATGMTTLLFLISATVFGVQVANGALRDVYQLHGSFAAAGQGLLQQSDVKIHGVNIGRVRGVELKDGRALVHMDIDAKEKVPVAAKATIRPKTLFGEKFVDIDPGDRELSGPFLKDEDFIKDTLGGFELEKVLTDLYPILKAIKPEHLNAVLTTLAEGGKGLGPTVNRTLLNFSQLADVQADHSADTQEFLDDLALLSDELAARGDDLIAAARDLNTALPVLNGQADQVTVVLDQLARLSGDVSDVLEANRPFLDKSVTKGGKTLQLLYDERAQIGPLVRGLREFFQILGEAGRIPRSDGTTMAAIKWILGEDCPNGRVEGCGETTTSAAAGAAAAPKPGGPAGPTAGGVLPPLPLPPLPPLPLRTTGTQAISEIVGGLFSS